MAKTNQTFRCGDSVEVKKGVRVPDYEALCIEGWQGRVVEHGDSEPSDVQIEWDSVTLRSMPQTYIEECERDGFSYDEMTLSVDDVFPVKPRDTAQDVEEARTEIAKSVSWLALGEEGRRIQRVLDGIDESDESAVFEAWEAHLRRVLRFPFDTEVEDSEDDWLIRYGDRLAVTGIAEIVDTYGIIVDVKRGEKHLQFPLCNLKALDRQSENWQPVNDHAVWFANR